MLKPHHRPLVAHGTLSFVCVALLFSAFLLSLLVSLSLTIIKTIYLLSVFSTRTGQPATSAATELRFGVWGVCATSVLNAPTFFANNGECFGPMLGYTIPADIVALTDISQGVINAVSQVLLFVLVLHPIAAGLSFITLFSSLFLASHGLTILSLVLAIITAMVTTAVFGIDLALVLVAKSQLPSLEGELQLGVQWGNAPWMGLAAAVLTWMAVIALSARACYCMGVRPSTKFRRSKF
ncbi:hypothetical protein FB45DRAFT_896889 [Roridomyces roridus]|uniref:Pali-domain-containing protein n=1 Tax=Roridomyces roridus TaxID=1738132 RepID=A0AAD7CAV1_9AGAR|nr:hypothetical protein FB45DRAFT_896889 [Roridomyces roridus]